MKFVIQRVEQASVRVDEEIIGKINKTNQIKVIDKIMGPHPFNQ